MSKGPPEGGGRRTGGGGIEASQEQPAGVGSKRRPKLPETSCFSTKWLRSLSERRSLASSKFGADGWPSESGGPGAFDGRGRLPVLQGSLVLRLDHEDPALRARARGGGAFPRGAAARSRCVRQVPRHQSQLIGLDHRALQPDRHRPGMEQRIVTDVNSVIFRTQMRNAYLVCEENE